MLPRLQLLSHYEIEAMCLFFRPNRMAVWIVL